MPRINRIVVVLPDPDGPMTPRIVPSGTCSETSATATTSPKLRRTWTSSTGKWTCATETPCASTTAGGGGGGGGVVDPGATDMRSKPPFNPQEWPRPLQATRCTRPRPAVDGRAKPLQGPLARGNGYGKGVSA